MFQSIVYNNLFSVKGIKSYIKEITRTSVLAGDTLVASQKVHHSDLNLVDSQRYADAVSWSIAKRKPFDWVSLGLFFIKESRKKERQGIA